MAVEVHYFLYSLEIDQQFISYFLKYGTATDEFSVKWMPGAQKS